MLYPTLLSFWALRCPRMSMGDVELPGQFLSLSPTHDVPCSAVLCPQDVALGDVELPGQYVSGLEVNPDCFVLCCAVLCFAASHPHHHHTPGCCAG